MSVLNTFDIKLLPKNVIHIRDKETERLYIYERDDYSSQTNKLLRKKIQDGQFTYEIQDFELHVKIILDFAFLRNDPFMLRTNIDIGFPTFST